MGRYYKKMEVYHLSYDFVLQIYKVLDQFPEHEKNNITSQLRRASVSIPLNIAEGAVKASRREFFHYLNIAFGSAKEVEVLIELSKDLGYFNEETYSHFSNKIDELNSKLYLFIRSVEKDIPNKQRFFRKFEGNINR